MKVAMRRVVGAVGDRAHGGEGHAVVVAHLRHRGALHLDRQRVGQRARAAPRSRPRSRRSGRRSPAGRGAPAAPCRPNPRPPPGPAARPDRAAPRRGHGASASPIAVSAAKRAWPVSGTSYFGKIGEASRSCCSSSVATTTSPTSTPGASPPATPVKTMALARRSARAAPWPWSPPRPCRCATAPRPPAGRADGRPRSRGPPRARAARRASREQRGQLLMHRGDDRESWQRTS